MIDHDLAFGAQLQVHVSLWSRDLYIYALSLVKELVVMLFRIRRHKLEHLDQWVLIRFRKSWKPLKLGKMSSSDILLDLPKLIKKNKI